MIQDNDPITPAAGHRDDVPPPPVAGSMVRGWRAALLSASPRRAVYEGCIVAAVMLALVWSASARFSNSQALVAGCFAFGELAALALVLRLRLPRGKRWRQIRAELTVAAVFAAAMSGLYTLIVSPLLPRLEPASPALIVIAAVVGLPALHGLTYLSLRGAVRVLRWWNELRQRRLLWALTHDQLVVVLALMLLAGAVAAIFTLGVALTNSATLASLSTDAVVRQALLLSVIGALYLGLTAAMLIGALPLAVLLSYVLVRRIVRRVEVLARATDALRYGKYATRVAVVGQDEIARLQANFNAMAAELDRTLRELQAERDRTAGLLQAQRELVASVSHELRTPVATQRAYLDTILRQEADLPAGISADLSVVERETQRLQTLIDDLFTLSRAEVGRLMLTSRPLDLGTVAERVVSTLAPLAWQSGRIELVAQIAAGSRLALADEGRFEQVLRNLIHNAIRHTPPGGLVAVAVAAEDAAIRVQVSDTGNGIAPEDLPRIWNRFYRADATRAIDPTGAGLGLALVKELTEAMGGSVEAASTIGVGSAFTIRLPHAAAPPPLPVPRGE